MPLRLPRAFRKPPMQRGFFSTAARVWPPHQLHMAHSAAFIPASRVVAPKMGFLSRWYLPTMALIALGTLTLSISTILPALAPDYFVHASKHRSKADRLIGIAIANGLEEYNMAHMNERQRKHAIQERNVSLLEAYGERMSLHDVERALEVYEVQ